MEDTLTAPYVLEYTYKRSVGPVIGRFLAGLRDGRVYGARTASGKVIVPPTEYDPESGEATGELIEVAQTGVIVTWAWVSSPRERHPLAKPFAWALVKLDGADTSMLHAVSADKESQVKSGARVKIKWRENREGGIRDVECFELVDA
jgi:uncharacterized OB-fold protein